MDVMDVMDTRPLPRRLLVVENDPATRTRVGDCLGEEGYRVTAATSIDEALAALAVGSFDLVLADAFYDPHNLDVDQWAALDRLRRAAGATPLLIFSSHPRATFEGFAARGFAGLVLKPFALDPLLATVRDCLTDKGTAQAC
jgi:two-component system response regulator GlrR